MEKSTLIVIGLSGLEIPSFLVFIFVVVLLVDAPLASAAEPLLCTDKRVLYNLKQAYDLTLMSNTSGRQFQAAEEVRETSSGSPLR